MEDRLGTNAVENISIPAQLSGNIYSQLAAWAGNGPLYSANVMVSGVIIAPLNSTVYQENTVQLSAEVLPWDASNKTVNWSSNNTDVATVNASGLVSAVTAGVATITATSVDGAKQASATINVTADPSYFIRTLQAENAQIGGALVASNNTGYNGTGFVDFQNATGDFITWVVNAPLAVNYTLAFRYAITSGNRPLSLSINGTKVNEALNFPGTGGNTTWNYITTNQQLATGNNTITLTSNGLNGANIDEIIVAASAVAPVSVTSIAVVPAKTTINVHTTRQLTTTVLPTNAINKNVNWTSSDLNIATVTAAGLVAGVGVGSAIITATTHDGWKNTSSEVTVIPAPVNKIISNCDTNVGWTSANSLTVFSSDKKEGLACLQSVGSSTDDFKLLLSTPINTGATIETDNLQFWYYVADNTLLSTNNQVELGSGGAPDVNEFSWNISNLVNGWNLINLPLKNANLIGTPNLGVINWFRIYRFKTASTTTRIDQIKIVENSVPNAVNEITQNNISIYQNALNKNFLTIATTDNFTLNNAHIIITNLQGQTVYRNRIQNSKSIEINTASFAGGAIYIIAVKSSEFTYKQKIINK